VYKSLSSSLCSLLQYPGSSSLLRPNILLSTLSSKHPQGSINKWFIFSSLLNQSCTLRRKTGGYKKLHNEAVQGVRFSVIFWSCSCHGLGPPACSDSVLTSETINLFRTVW
jgi:hypothetical protein